MAREVDGLFGGNGKLEDEDPVSSLFKADKTMPAPQIADDQPSAAEVSRWRATTQSSLFANEVKDPPPEAAPMPDEPMRERTSPSRADQRALGEAPTLLGMAPPAADAAKKRVPPPAAIVVPDELPAPPPAGDRRKKGPGKRRRPQRPRPHAEAAAAAKAAEASPTPRRNAAKQRKNALLGVLALVALGAASAVAMLLGVVPNPLASDGAGRLEAPPAKAAAPERSAPAKAQPSAAPAKPPASAAPATAAPQARAAAEKAGSSKAAGKAADKPAEKAATSEGKARAAKAPSAAAAPEVRTAQAKPAPAAGGTEAAAEEILDARRAVVVARQKLADDQAEAAEALMRNVLQEDPRNHHAMDVLARALIDQDRGKEAVEYARQAVERRKRRARYRVVLGDALLMTGDEARARAQWRAALDLEPKNRGIRQRLGL